ncbi:MAG: LysM peptidoglycan-binding domain-containing protein [Clostridiales bacterium]|jgi:LysM repeat protein|nr:LysM peptidoglycan-binding domain-containing protein [Clostridiales bacterium]
MDQFELPANIKQIGSIGEGLRIYVEDYVCSYLYTYAEAGGYQERIALLVGRYLIIDNQPILFINGAIQGRYTEVRNGLTLFTDRSMDYAQTCIDQYFPGMKIVGWMQSQPSYGVYLNSGYIDVHMNHFKKKYQVMFVMDPIEKANAFYTYTKSGMTLEETKGYFIYYDKNESMHEYIVQNKMSDNPENAVMVSSDTSLPPDHAPVIDSLRSRSLSKVYTKESQEQKRVLNLLVGLCAVLFIVSFIVGAGLIQNQDRISLMERQLVQLNASYKNLALQFSKDTTVPVSGGQETSSVPDAAATSGVIQTDGSGFTERPSSTPEPTDEPTRPVTPATIPETYTIRDGDTLNSISLRFYGTSDMVSRIMEYNGITDPNLIVSGRIIELPSE